MMEGLESVRQVDFIKAECNLETIGFFTHSKRGLKNARRKTVSFRKKVEGVTREVEVTIIASGEELPNTRHQDIYRAFQSILTDKIREEGQVPKHVTFTTAEVLQRMGKGRSQMDGRMYRMVEEWLDVMTFTGIKVTGKGVIWHAREKRWGTARVTVFDKAVSCGRELVDGTVADCHHVWLSDWQYGNINEHYLLSIDYELYKQLKNNISKALFSTLHNWFYVGKGKYRKKYDELCRWMGIKEYRSLSRIKQQLDPSHRELEASGFLGNWEYEQKRRGQVPVITWEAGRKYYEDKRIISGRGGKKGSERQVGRGFSDEARSVVMDFHRRLGRKRKPTEAELEKAERLVEENGEEAARFVLECALKDARKTGFDMRDFGALKLYEEEALGRFHGEREAAAESEKSRKKEAVRLVEHLHKRVGRMGRPETGEIEQAEVMLSKQCLKSAIRLVDEIVKDADGLGMKMTSLCQVDEVMERVCTEGSGGSGA